MSEYSLTPIPELKRLSLVISPRAARAQMLEMAAMLSLRGTLRVFDGGNSLDVYRIARSIRRRTPRVEEALERIHLSRAFSCYQVVTLLTDAPVNTAPLLVCDLLGTFYDENVTLKEAHRLLDICLKHLRRLSLESIVVVSARPPRLNPERLELLDRLSEAIGDVHEIIEMEEEQRPALPTGIIQPPLPF